MNSLKAVRRGPILPWFYGWNAVAVGIFTVAMLMGAVNFSFTFYVVSWIDEFGSSRTIAMLALSAGQICGGLLLPFSGRAMDRYSIRWLASGGILIFGIAFFLISYAASMLQIILLYALFISAAEALAGPLLAQTIAAKWFRARRGMAIGLAALGTSIGGFLLPPVVVYFLIEYGWRTAHLYVALIVMVVTIPMLLLIVRNSPEQKGLEPEPEGDSKRSVARGERTWSTRQILTSRVFWLIVIGFLPAMETTTSIVSNLALYTKDLDIDTQRAAFLMSTLSLMMISGKIGFGYLADRVDLRVLFFAGIALLATALLTMVGHPSYPVLLLIIVLVGLSAGGQLPLAGAMIGHNFGALSFGSVMGLFYLCIRPVAFGGPIGGWVRDTFGSYDYFWLASLAIILTFSPAIFWVKEGALRR